MKYILSSVLTILGIFFIIIGLTAPTTLSLINTSSGTSFTVSGIPYPSSTSQSSPTVFPNAGSANLYINFTTGYYTSDDISVSNLVGTLTIDGSAVTPTITYNIPYIFKNGLFLSAVNVSMKYTYNNPNTNTVHSFQWSVSAKVYDSDTNTFTTISGTSSTYYGQFYTSSTSSTATTVYPGYFVIAYPNPYNGQTTYQQLTPSSNININYPSGTTFPVTIRFLYVEYNASGNTLNNFQYAYIQIANGLSISPQYNIASTNTTTYTNVYGTFPALYIDIKFNQGTYSVFGYAVYSVTGYGQKPIQVMGIILPMTSNTPSTINITTQSYYEIGLGIVLLSGAYFTFRRRL